MDAKNIRFFRERKKYEHENGVSDHNLDVNKQHTACRSLRSTEGGGKSQNSRTKNYVSRKWDPGGVSSPLATSLTNM